MIAIIGYGMGNVQSVVNALDYIGAPNFVATRPDQLDYADKVLLPGVGTFRKAMSLLDETGFRKALDEQVKLKSKPLLGICLGMQILAETGTEFGDCAGLGYVPGRVEVIPMTNPVLRLPQIGWNELSIISDCPLLSGVKGEDGGFFIHSYYLNAAQKSHISATCDYGGSLTAAVSVGHIFGMQFHPEKSQPLGLVILENFAAL